MACSPSYPNPHPCAIDGCTRATLERRCDEHQAQLERNLAQLARENTLATCTCPYCDVPPRIVDQLPGVLAEMRREAEHG